MLAIGLGVGIIVSPLTASVLNAASRERSGIASGINNSVEEVSSLIAVALFGTIALLLFQQALSSHLLLAGVDASQVSRAVEEVGQNLAGGDIPSFVHEGDRAGLEAAVTAAFLDSFRTMMLAAAGIAVLSAVVAAVMIDARPLRVPSPVQRVHEETVGEKVEESAVVERSAPIGRSACAAWTGNDMPRQTTPMTFDEPS
jgi:hypothetical protein